MGLCESKDLSPEEQKENVKNKKLNQKLGNDRTEDEKYLKLLLLGSGESGKSTLFKQMKSLTADMPKEERLTFKQVIHSNVIEAMLNLLQGIPNVEEKTGKTITLSDDIKEDIVFVNKLTTADFVTPEIGERFRKIWGDQGIQETYENRSCFQLIDSAEYFFNRIWDENEPITDPNYCPCDMDVLRSRVRTTGIVEEEFEYESNKFRVFDVGGQRNERKKWIHCFENVTALLFVGVLSEYDMQLYEDEKMNRMVETLKLFRETVNNGFFQKTEIILFLNKRDLFTDKINHVPLTACDEIFRPDEVRVRSRDDDDDPDKFHYIKLEDPEAFYNLPTPFEAGCEAIKQQFLDQFNVEGRLESNYIHLTSAIDKDNFRLVFNEVKEIIVKQSLGAAGLM